jgi:hypothetical protein
MCSLIILCFTHITSSTEVIESVYVKKKYCPVKWSQKVILWVSGHAYSVTYAYPLGLLWIALFLKGQDPLSNTNRICWGQRGAGQTAGPLVHILFNCHMLHVFCRPQKYCVLEPPRRPENLWHTLCSPTPVPTFLEWFRFWQSDRCLHLSHTFLFCFLNTKKKKKLNKLVSIYVSWSCCDIYSSSSLAGSARSVIVKKNFGKTIVWEDLSKKETRFIWAPPYK